MINSYSLEKTSNEYLRKYFKNHPYDIVCMNFCKNPWKQFLLKPLKKSSRFFFYFWSPTLRNFLSNLWQYSCRIPREVREWIPLWSPQGKISENTIGRVFEWMLSRFSERIPGFISKRYPGWFIEGISSRFSEKKKYLKEFLKKSIEVILKI